MSEWGRMTGEKRRFVVLLGLMLGPLAITGWAHFTGRLTTEDLEALVAAGGIWSPLLFVMIASVAPLVWVPRMMTSIAAGALFGFWAGAALALMGGFGGALAGYWLGHSLGHDFVMKKIGPRGKAISDFLARRGLVAIALGRISPVTNCEAISLGSGLIGLPMRVYIPSTIVGMLPGSLLYSAFGSSVVSQNDSWTGVALSVVLAFLMTAATGWWLWRMWKKDKAEQLLRLERAERREVPATERGETPA